MIPSRYCINASYESFLFIKINTYIETLDLSDNGLGSIGGTSMGCMLKQNYCITDLVRIEIQLNSVNKLNCHGKSNFARVIRFSGFRFRINNLFVYRNWLAALNIGYLEPYALIFWVEDQWFMAHLR